MCRFALKRSQPGKHSFTLIEMLVAIAVLVILLGILFSITNTVAKTIVNTSVKTDTFAAARTAFDVMSQKLSQATLNTYWDYDNPLLPTHYYRQSDQQFLVVPNEQNSGYGQEVYFVTPSAYATNAAIQSTDGLLNACGYYVSYGPDTTFQPSSITATAPTRYRYRLMQGMQPTEKLGVYANWPATPTGTVTWASYWSGNWATYWQYTAGASPAWVGTIYNTGSTPNTYVSPVANNIIALIVWPHLSAVEDPPGGSGKDGTTLTGSYTYNSQDKALTLDSSGNQPITANQLPPTVQLTVIAISEASAARLNMGVTAPSAIETALTGKFGVSSYTQYQADLASVSTSLSANHISFEILNTSVTMKESKWSDKSQP